MTATETRTREVRSGTRRSSSTRGRMRRAAARMFTRAMDDNIRLLAWLARRPAAAGPLCDIGCSNGSNTLRYAARGRDVIGLDGEPTALVEARERGIDGRACDLRERWPVRSASVGVVTSNQVIEHVPDVDHFVAECERILVPGGRAVISTENLASWHNIAALALGWQPFSLTNISARVAGLGNPCANLRLDEPLGDGWHHMHVMSSRALHELFAAHGFEDVRVHGAGYYPLATRCGRADPRHAAFIVVEARKPDCV